MSNVIIAIDQGTTGTTVSIINAKGQCLGKVNQEYPQIFPKPGWVEHNPEDIWQTVGSCTKKVLRKTKLAAKNIVAIGITNQRETVVVWDRKTGKPVHNAIVWQCRRTADLCRNLKNQGYEKVIKRKTGLVLDPYFSASKLQWIFKNNKSLLRKAKSGELACGTVDTFLLWRLTNGKSHKTDVSNASRTMLMNIKNGKWDQELLDLFQVPHNILPEISSSNAQFGFTKGLSFLPDGIPITGIAGDQQAALFGQACFKQGESKCTFGTGSFILMNTGEELIRSKKGLLTTVAWQLENQKKMTYALEGGAFICGAAVQWLRDNLGIIKKSSDIESLAAQVNSSEGVEFVPALSGLGAPYWDPEARGIISGLTRGSTKAHIAFATLEAMALQNSDILNVMEKELGRKMKNLKVDGGAAVNNLLMQLQCDYLGQKIVRPQMIETTAAGAAFLAGLGVGLWTSTGEIKKVWQVDKEFKSSMSKKQRGIRMQSWEKAIKRSLLY